MRFPQRTLVHTLTALLLLNSAPPAKACGPFFTEPIFVFADSPDLPFSEFTNGKIGIVLPTFGRKTLTIAYRYLNGGSFTTNEQTELITALKGKAPEDDGSAAVKEWIKTRKTILREDGKLPDIYVERQHGEGYDFFPNCTRNAFEVATETLNDRATRYGPEDVNVRNWLAAQDTVFQNCSGGKQVPTELGAESPTWLRKDRDYQIAAAHFYSLAFDEARARFEKIAADVDSPWQELASYLVARTLVRQASLAAGTEAAKHEFYEHAETYLQNLLATSGQFTFAGRRLLALVKYHLHPEERLIEIGRSLAEGNDENLRQDLIDYVWLLDKFRSRILKAEEDRRHKLDPNYHEETSYEWMSKEDRERYEKVQRGELIQISFLRRIDNVSPYKRPIITTFKHDVTDAEIFATVERIFGQKLTDDEMYELKQSHETAMKERQYRVSPNRQWDNSAMSQYDGDYSTELNLTLDLRPEFLRADDLTDWIFTVQNEDPKGYGHALAKWRETRSPAWLATALIKAEKSSPKLPQLMRAAEKITRDEPSFATVAYHLVRLKIALGNEVAARKLLDDIISWQADVLPQSAQNQFLEQRMSLAENLSAFLKSAQRKPAAFSEDGSPGTMRNLVERAKRAWNPEYTKLSREEYEREVERDNEDFLPWDNRVTFDAATVDILNQHFPLQLLARTTRDPDLPDYLQGRLALAVWTRAILLDNDEVAQKIAPAALKAAPKMGEVFEAYLKARSRKERHDAALYVLLKFPDLSPFVGSIIPTFVSSEDVDYYFGTSWWCTPEATEYNEAGVQVPKVVPKPSFLTAAQLDVARREHRALVDVGDGKPYLGKEVIEWAKASPGDPRIPEALFIAGRANQSYKYGCGGWDHNEALQQEAEKILKQRYPTSPWTAKLRDSEK